MKKIKKYIKKKCLFFKIVASALNKSTNKTIAIPITSAYSKKSNNLFPIFIKRILSNKKANTISICLNNYRLLN
jgi:hypothetical protein